MKHFTLFFYILFILPGSFLFSVAQNKEADKIIGEWYTEGKESAVEIYKRGDQYFGKIVWLKNPTYEDGSPKVDKNNDDVDKQKRPLIGLELLKGFVYDGDLEWDDGEIYNPKDGDTYSCVMELEDENTLDVRGYVGISLFGKSQTWTRKE